MGGGREASRQRSQDIARELERIDLRQQEIKTSVVSLEKQLHDREGETTRLEEQAERVRQEEVEARTELRESDLRLQEHQARREMHRSRVEALRGVMESYEGYQLGVRSVLSELAHLPGIIGTVADIVETEGRYIIAVEAKIATSI